MDQCHRHTCGDHQVRAEYCRVSWEKPEDDGGTEITSYTVNLLDLSQGEWVTVAEPTSLTAEIKNLRPGHLYRFSVSWESTWSEVDSQG